MSRIAAGCGKNAVVSGRKHALKDEQAIRELVTRLVDEVVSSPADAPAPTVAGPPAEGAGREPRRVALGADHGGYRLKDLLAAHLRDRGYEVEDCGTSGPDSVDYPDFAHAVARRVARGQSDCGIVVDGAGIGSSMAANKVPGVRAALCYDVSSAKNSREHNHANVLTLGAGLIGDGLARQIVDVWLATPWGPGRHARRVEKIDRIEASYLRPAPAAGSAAEASS